MRRRAVSFMRRSGGPNDRGLRLNGDAPDRGSDKRKRLAHTLALDIDDRKPRSQNRLAGSSRQVAVARKPFPDRLNPALPL